MSEFLSENFQVLTVKFSVYLNRRVFVMTSGKGQCHTVDRQSNTLIFLLIICYSRDGSGGGSRGSVDHIPPPFDSKFHFFLNFILFPFNLSTLQTDFMMTYLP